jgi:hypothetical protein
VLLSAAIVGGCSTVSDRNTTAAVATIVAAHTPTTSVSQVYYLGVFDPHDQLPPTIYRVRVQGQASALNFTKFASGWVRAELIDSLSSRIDSDGKVSASAADALEKGALGQRRLVMFGPEGFREAPRDHRLVIVMGSSPQKFFSAVDSALGLVASVTQGQGDGPAIEKALWEDMGRIRVLRQEVDLVLDAVKLD